MPDGDEVEVLRVEGASNADPVLAARRASENGALSLVL
jgi:hypothetical protein